MTSVKSIMILSGESRNMSIKSTISLIIMLILKLLTYYTVAEKIMGISTKGRKKYKAVVSPFYVYLMFLFMSVIPESPKAYLIYSFFAAIMLAIIYGKKDLASIVSFFSSAIGIELFLYLYRNIQTILQKGPSITLTQRIIDLGFNGYIRIYLLTYLTVLLLSFLWINYRNSDGRYTLYFIIPLVCAEIIICIWMWLAPFLVNMKYLDYSSKSGYLFSYVVALVIMVAAFLTGIIFLDMQRYRALAKQNRILLNAQTAHYSYMEETVENTRKFRHDIKNHLISLNHILEENDYSRARNYLDEITEHCNDLKFKYNSGNYVIDAMIEEQNAVAQKYGIDFSLTGALPNELKIETYDLCTIVGNLLSNAVEGASNTNNRRYVAVELGYYNHFIHINVKNSTSGRKKWSITAKSDIANHGYGLLNIREAVNKYNGIIKIESTDHDFESDVLVPDEPPGSESSYSI